jgi:hypothetical protein
MVRCHARYELVTAEPFACVGAVIEMILASEGVRGVGQNQICERLGLHVPATYAGPIRNVVRTFDRKKWGVVITEGMLNRLFEELDVPIREAYAPVSRFQDWEFVDKARDALQSGSHVICGYDPGVLARDQRPETGHVALMTFVENETIGLLDPGPEGAGFRAVEAFDLYRAIHARKDGLWEIKANVGAA